MPVAAAEVVIDAPIGQVWDAILDIDRYPEWNPFTPKVDCPGGPRVGAPIRLHVRWGNGKAMISPERVVRIDPPATDSDGVVRGVYGYNFGTLAATLNLVRSERLQIVEAEADGRTRYRTRIRLTGLLSGLTPIAQVQDGFDRQTAALKTYCESARRA